MDIILMHVIQPYKSRKPAAHRLAKELINKSATYMEPNIQKFFNAALMKGLETDSGKQLRPLVATTPYRAIIVATQLSI